jgi:hypothetical protein
MKLEDFFKQTYRILLAEHHLYNLSIPMMGIRPRIICSDGFSMSVQGSQYSYSEPKITTDWYESLEIGFPSDDEELFNEYGADGDVYGYVPVNIIQAVIDKHNGIDVFETLKEEKWHTILIPYTRNNILDDLGI